MPEMPALQTRCLEAVVLFALALAPSQTRAAGGLIGQQTGALGDSAVAEDRHASRSAARARAAAPRAAPPPRALRGGAASSAAAVAGRRASSSSSSVSQLVWNDTNEESGQIGCGSIRWTPPGDESQISFYEVYIAYDDQGSYQAKLWWEDFEEEDFGNSFPVGTNEFNIFHNTRRMTMDSAYPANWLIVYTNSGGVQQDVSEAAKVRLYDHSTVPPPPVDFAVAFTDTDAEDPKIAGTLTWSPVGQADFGFTTHYAVYLARDASGSGEASLQRVPYGTNELVIAPGTECWDRNHLLVHASNPNGKSASASFKLLDGCTTPQPTTTITVTTTTVTTTTRSTSTITTASTITATETSTTSTTTIDRSAVTFLSFNDTNEEANQIGRAVVEWSPPADASQVTGYEVYAAHDSLGAHKARLWYSDHDTEEFGDTFRVGTNRFFLYDPTRRQTVNEAFPANWVLVYSRRGNQLQATENAAKVRLYDLSTEPPVAIALSLDTSATRLTGSGDLTGAVRWTVEAGVDLGFVEHWAVYVAAAPGDTGSEVPVQDVPLGAAELRLQGAVSCAQGEYVGVYAKNRIGRAPTASWSRLQACPNSVVVATTTTTLATTTTATTAQLGQGGVALAFTDANAEAYQIGGSVVQWAPTFDPQVTHYEVFIAFDAQGSYKAQLWHMDPVTEELTNELPVGTNEFHIFDPTRRQTVSGGHPANWLMVFTSSGGALQDAGGALKVPLYDLSDSAPPLIAMASITFVDTDPEDYRIAGTLQWEPEALMDLALASHYAVFLAKDTAGTDEVILETVPIGTNELVIAQGTECWDSNHLLIYASNDLGREASAGKRVGGCTTPRPTTTGTTVTATVSSSSTATVTASSTLWSPTAVKQVVFTDTNDEAGQIGGATIQWAPPAVTSQVTSYEVFIAYDQHGSHQAQLWYQDAQSGDYSTFFPVGTNQFQLFENTRRGTMSPAHPANHVLVYALFKGLRQAVSEAGTVPLYDLSSMPPYVVNFMIVFTDTDAADPTIEGPLRWTPLGQADLGLSTDYTMYLARDANGDGEQFLQNVPVGTNELVIAPGTACWDRNHLLIYVSNPNGRSAHASSKLLDGCTTPEPTTTTTGTSVTTVTGTGSTTTATTSSRTTISTTTLTTISPTALSSFTFTDEDPEANRIGGAILQWTPPLDESQISSYEVYAAYDELGTHQVRLWYSNSVTEEFGSVFPVGTNRFHLFAPTVRRTASGGHPANWVLVYSRIDGQLQDIGEVVKARIYDRSGDVPSGFAVDLDAARTSLTAQGELSGTVRWAVSTPRADLAFTTSLGIYVASDATGSGEELIRIVSLASDAFALPSGRTCDESGFLAVYLQNPNGRALASPWLHLPPCAPTTTTSTATATTTRTATDTGPTGTVTSTTTTTVEPTRISLLTFTDANPAAGQIGGSAVQWLPPADLSGVTAFEAYIAYDALGTHQAQLWWEDRETWEIGMDIPVGTNRFNLFTNTYRRTMVRAYPANWLLVYTTSGGSRQAVSEAAKIPLYDDSAGVPTDVAMAEISFNDTDPADPRIAGAIRWTPAAFADLGLAQHYELYVATDAAGGGEEMLLGMVPVTENELIVREGTYCWDKRHLLIFPSNSYGRSAVPATKVLEGCTTPQPTSTITITTTTARTFTETTGPTTTPGSTETFSTSTVTLTTTTSTTTLAPHLISGLTFADANSEAGEIGGAVVQWNPPKDISGVMHYEVYLAYDELGSHKAQMWYANPVTEAFGMEFPVGTNQFSIFDPTTRKLPNPEYPANWVLVFTRSDGVLQSIDEAAKVILYDHSNNAPGSLSLTLDFEDRDPEDSTIAGTLRWTHAALTDFGFTTDYVVHLAGDAIGTGASQLFTVPVGTNEVAIPFGTECWDSNYLLVYASNPNGMASLPSSMVLGGCSTPRPTPTGPTTTETATTTTAPPAVLRLNFTDTNPAAGHIGGSVVRWSPPEGNWPVTGYRVYLAHDAEGSYRAELWHADPATGDIAPRLHVGTNEFHIADPTRRQTTNAAYPANWLLVLLEIGGVMQDISDAAHVPLYDLSSNVPHGISLSVNFVDTDPAPFTFGGILTWVPAAMTDFGATTHFAVYQAEDRLLGNKTAIQSVPVGTNEILIPHGKECYNGDYLLVYASNPNGNAVQASAVASAMCATSTSTITTSTTLPPLFSFPLSEDAI